MTLHRARTPETVVRPRAAIHMAQPKMQQAVTDQFDADRRKGVRRTVTILVVIVAAFFLVSFVQILLMK